MSRCQANAKCSYPGCSEWGHFSYETRREMREPFEIKRRHEWKCSIHSNMDQRLTLSDLKKEKVMTCMEGKSSGSGVYFEGMHGRISGPGFWVLSEDFPVGTKLKVTAEIILP